jgi:hypothetical protein
MQWSWHHECEDYGARESRFWWKDISAQENGWIAGYAYIISTRRHTLIERRSPADHKWHGIWCHVHRRQNGDSGLFWAYVNNSPPEVISWEISSDISRDSSRVPTPSHQGGRWTGKQATAKGEQGDRNRFWSPSKLPGTGDIYILNGQSSDKLVPRRKHR